MMLSHCWQQSERKFVDKLKTLIMGNLLRLLILSIGIIIFTGCETDDTHPYYRFNSEDETLLIKYNYIPNQIISYQNQFGEQLHFKVILNERKKNGYYSRGTFSGGGGHLEHYYDNITIKLEILENPSYEEYSKVNYYFSKNGVAFNSGMNFPLWNITTFGFIDQLQNKVNIFNEDYKDLERIQMDINGHNFDNVVIINSNSNEINDASSFGPLLQNVNKIYYDYDFGIVQFIDIEDKEWKVIYPE